MGRKPSLSVVTLAELYAGLASEAERQNLDTFAESVAIIPVFANTAEQAGQYVLQYRAAHSVDIVDALIAATANVHNLPLVTLNLKHFPMFPTLERPY